jgi:hypothetical protein
VWCGVCDLWHWWRVLSIGLPKVEDDWLLHSDMTYVGGWDWLSW